MLDEPFEIEFSKSFPITFNELSEEQKKVLKSILNSKNYEKIEKFKAGTPTLWKAISHILHERTGYFGNKSSVTPEFFSYLKESLPEIFAITSTMESIDEDMKFNTLTVMYFSSESDRAVEATISVNNFTEIMHWLKELKTLGEIINWKAQ